MNQLIIDNFEKLIIKANQENLNKFKIISYRKVINIIKKLDFEIESIEQIKDVKGIGKSSLKRISEILENKSLKELNNLSENTLTNSNQILNLQRITGIGPVKAKKLFEENITLDKLLKIDFDLDDPLLNKLTHHQIIGLKYFNDLEKRIPYKEIQNIEKYLNKIIKKIDKKLKLTICGSFRRKKENSGDIDILITHDDISNDKELKDKTYLKDLIDILTENNFIVDNLTYNGNTKYMGLCKYKKNYVRRIDIRFIPLNSYASSLLYFTGSGEFNKNMRTFAIKSGYTLNEYGLYKQLKINDKKVKIKTEKEEDIFTALKLSYVLPENRTELYKFL